MRKLNVKNLFGILVGPAIIISGREPQIASRIMKEMNRGVTEFQGRGGYTGDEKSVLFVVLGRSELVKLKNLVYAEDPAAFISIGEASEVVGEGFSLDQNKEPLAV